MVLLILIGAMLLVGIPLYIQYRMSGSPKANAPMPRAQSSWHHHHPTGKSKSRNASQTKATQNAGDSVQTPEAKVPADKNIQSTDTISESQPSAPLGWGTSAASEKNALNEQNQPHQTTAQQQPYQQESAQQPAQEEESEVCCGLHEVCEKLATNSNKVEYFDDEELDVFAGRDPESYNDNEIDQFRDVMTTMYPSEVALWRQSLQLRGVALPVELEDEFMLILSEV